MSKKGFTIIEALTLTVIIGLVAFVVAFLLTVLKERANDTKRVAEMNQIAKALELFYDKNAEYPGILDELVASGLLLTIPTPPPGASQTHYSYIPLGKNYICTGYHLGASMETGYRDMVKNDADAYPDVPCAKAITADFDGTALNCQIGAIGEGAGKGNCYDIKI